MRDAPLFFLRKTMAASVRTARRAPRQIFLAPWHPAPAWRPAPALPHRNRRYRSQNRNGIPPYSVYAARRRTAPASLHAQEAERGLISREDQGSPYARSAESPPNDAPHRRR